jgi:thymidylate kinase
LAEGQWVVCDRFTDSTVAYQGAGRQFGAARVEQLEQWLHADLQPDRTYLFDLAPEEAARRRARVRAADRFEAEDLAFFQRVRSGYEERLERDRKRPAGPRMLRLDADQAADDIWNLLEQDLVSCCKLWI